MATTTESVNVSLILLASGQNPTSYRLRQNAGRLQVQRSISGGPRTNLADMAFDLGEQAIWQLRATQKELFVEVGPTENALTVIASDPIDSAAKQKGVEDVAILLIAETTELIGAPGEAHFDYFEQGCI